MRAIRNVVQSVRPVVCDYEKTCRSQVKQDWRRQIPLLVNFRPITTLARCTHTVNDVMGRPEDEYRCIRGFPVECLPRSMTFLSSLIIAADESALCLTTQSLQDAPMGPPLGAAATR